MATGTSYLKSQLDTLFSAVTNALGTKADLVSGKVPPAQLGSGTASASTVLSGAGTYVTLPSGGGSGTASTTTFTPAGTVSATNVQAAIAELDSEAVARARLALLPDGGNSIWTRSTDPAGLAINGDVWLAP